jgi:tungstate transport system substrate-binding protein
MFKMVLAVVALTLVMTGCGPATTPEPTQVPSTEVVEPTEAVPEVVEQEPTEAPAEEPTTEPTEALESEPQRMVLATTTSTYDSGLLDFILPDFESEYNVQVEVIAVGTGQALQLGMDGDADVLLVHSRTREDAFMDEGHGVRREDVMYNDFVIIGPADDPAGIMGKKKATRAFETIAETESTFISRGDDSGTHGKELSIWADAGIEPAGDWYVSAGQGMGAVLTMANEQLAYTLSDRATYLARTLEGIELEIMVEGDSVLFNPYGVLAVDPGKNEEIQGELADQFIEWLISVPTQEKIATFGIEEFGSPLFTPDSQPWNDAQGSAEEPAEEAAGDDVALQITGLVAEETGWTEEETMAMETMDAEAENSKGETETYTGVSLNALLDMVVPAEDATTLVIVASDGYTAEVDLAEIRACDDCILSFRTQGGFRATFPGFPSSTAVKGVVEIQVQ